MSVTPVSAPPATRPVRRVREQVWESLAVMAFSAAASATFAGGLVLISTLVR